MKKITYLDIMRYYVAYYDIEKNIINAIQNKKNSIPAFHFYMSSYMKIARNFKPQMAEKILNEVEKIISTNPNISVTDLSKFLVDSHFVSRPEIKQVEVASSKILWLYNHETIIMDNNNKHILDNAKNYNEYVILWEKLFNEKESEINSAIKLLNIQDPILNEKWFQMRVFDLYLLSIYNIQNNKY
jgi:hypothetical protein